MTGIIIKKIMYNIKLHLLNTTYLNNNINIRNNIRNNIPNNNMKLGNINNLSNSNILNQKK